MSPSFLSESTTTNSAVLQCAEWSVMPWLIHGFSTRKGGFSQVYLASGETAGDLNLGFTLDDRSEDVARNRAELLRILVSRSGSLAADLRYRLVTLRQTHSAVTHYLEHADNSEGSVCEGDGLMTRAPGLLLAIQTADCVPVLIADPQHKAVAAFHAGWRGTVQRIVEAGVAKMQTVFSSNPEQLVAAIGPCIRQCCYEVGDDLRREFRSQFDYADELFREKTRNDDTASEKRSLFLDLVEANRRQLLAAGLPAGRIFEIGTGSDGCTACHPEQFFSYRRSHGRTGRMMSVIGIRREEATKL